MNTNELAELMLVWLYDRAEAEAHSFFFFPLGDFAASAGITDENELLMSAETLERMGLIMLSQDMFGQISALINMDGSIFVEKGGETGIIGKYRADPLAFLKPMEETCFDAPPIEFETTSFAPELAKKEIPDYGPGHVGSLQEIKNYITQIIGVIMDDPTLDDVMRDDLLRDVETLNIQLAKSRRNRTVIDALLLELSSIPSAAHLVAQLSSFI